MSKKSFSSIINMSKNWTKHKHYIIQLQNKDFKMQNQSSENITKIHFKLSSLTLAELLENLDTVQQTSPTQIKFLKLYIISHPQLIPLIKNQSSLLKKIFTYQNTKILISYLTQEHSENLQQLDQSISRFKEVQKYPLSLRLPYTAMEVLSSECHLLTNLLFDGAAQKPSQSQNFDSQPKKEPLIKKVFQFLDYRQHYLLAGYFNKVISSITKRVYSTSHKYNSSFCECIFGENTQNMLQSNLFKTINHLYSASTIEYTLKWLSISTKTKVSAKQIGQEFIQEIPASVIDFKRGIKEKYLLTLVQKLNRKQLSDQILANIPVMFQQLFSQESSNSTIKIPQNMMIPFTMKKQQKKLSLYQLSTSLNILKLILEPLQVQKLTLAKIQLIKVVVTKYKGQYKNLSQSHQNTQQKDKIQYNLFERIQAEDLQQLIIWIFVSIKNILLKQALEKGDKRVLLHFIQLLYQIHTIQILQETIWSYYNDNKDQLVEIATKIMLVNNNLIQIAQSRLIKFVLGFNRSANSIKHFVPFEFATTLLIDGVISIIDQPGIREHVISWAEIILDFQKQHIFQNFREESQWDHVAEIIQYQKQITIGNSQFFPCNLDIFYSKQKANLVYTNFMMNFKIVVEYQDKEAKIAKTNKKRSNYQKQPQFSKNQDPKIVSNQQPSFQNILKQQKVSQKQQLASQQAVQEDPLSFSTLRLHYLNFDVNHLLQQL